MANIQPHSQFINIDRVISQYSNPPSDKVLLTRNKRITFNVMFKETPPVREGVL